MKKLLLIPILALAMSFAWSAVNTPVASARPHNRGHGYYKHHRHHSYRNYSRHYRHNYRPYRHYRHYRYRDYDNDSFFLGFAFPGFYFGASHFDRPHHHGPWCYR